MKLVIISDTHGRHADLGVLEGDVLIHCGDLAAPFDGNGESLAGLDDWFGRQRFDRILYTGGNHDFHLRELLKTNAQPIRNAEYLEDRAIAHEGLKFYGAPWTPFMPGFAFHLDEEKIRAKWDLIPVDTDVLITHTPPFGILDKPGGNFKNSGCPHLRERVLEIRPQIHCFGHVHAGYGALENRGTTFVNAALVGGNDRIKDTPVVLIR